MQVGSVNEILFIGGDFFDCDLPKDKAYLVKYFHSDLEKQFLRYYYCFEEFDHFTDHTGYRCQKRWLKLLLARLKKITTVHAKAKSEMDLELLALIESGAYKFL